MPVEQQSLKLCVQIQISRAPSLDRDRMSHLFGSMGANKDIVERYVVISDEHGGEYINFIFETKAVGELWRQIRDRIYKDAVIGNGVAQSSLAICEGRNGWDDYLLLYHFDSSEKLDTLE